MPRPTEEDQPVEPMIRINHTGWGIRVTTIIQVVVLLLPIVGAWYNVTSSLVALAKQVEDGRVLAEKQLQEVKGAIDRNRLEGIADIKELQSKGSETTSEVARLQEQLKNLQLLFGDIRDQLRTLDRSGELRTPGGRPREQQDTDKL